MTYRTTFVNPWPVWQDRLKSGYLVDANGCHVWQRSKNSRGYGVIWFDGKLHLAHRAAWLLAHGEWPPAGLVTDHICNNKACVNAAHLRPLTNAENIIRAYARGDAETERRRAGNRLACERYRSRKGGESNGLV